MRLFRAEGSAVVQLASQSLLLTALGFGVSQVSLAEDRTIPAQSAKFECSSAKPGDTLTLEAGLRGPLKISNCQGTKDNPIIIRNDPDGNGPAVIRRDSGSNGGFIFDCNNCVDVEIDGSYKWKGAPGGKTYGIQITMTGGQGPSAFLRMSGLSRDFTIRNVEIDGAWPRLNSHGSGIRINDNRATRSRNPGLWRENILIEDNYIHDIKSEGMYVGPNYRDGELPLRDVEIRHNRLEDIGWEAINTKSMWEGNNSIHHNEVRRAGKSTSDSNDSSQYSGIKNSSGTVKIYNNWIESTGQHGIRVWTQDGPKVSENRGPFVAQIWNNVIVDAGGLWKSFMAKSHGIGVGAEDGVEKPIPYIYNNTIVGARHSAIGLNPNVDQGFIRDNVIAGTSSNPVIVAPGRVEVLDNSIGSISQMAFIAPDRSNYRLSNNSPGWNEGSNDSPPNDFDDVKRPQDGAPDQGAYEGSN